MHTLSEHWLFIPSVLGISHRLQKAMVMAAGTTEYATQDDGKSAAAALDDVQPLPRAVALLAIVGLSGGLWYGIYRLAIWLFW